ncbi:MFS transporter [uncultured Parolsenella sp.]|uniref:MFS transporter n=1 Tax=uncultured Parolsenella sp. TaxID=2083008 RepID=UPI0027DCF1EE|nr:MFS transporter [uncultured Parolsenella sp.]
MADKIKDKFSGKQWVVLASLWLAYLLSFVARLVWSSVMSIANEDLGFTVIQGSSYITAFYIGYAITALPGGILSDKIGYRKTILLSLAGVTVGTALMGTVTDYYVGFAFRFILGLFSGPLNACCLSAIADVFSERQRGTATGLLMTCTSLGISVVNLYAPSLATNYGWQVAMFATAVIPLAILVLCFFTLRGAAGSGDSGEKAKAQPSMSVGEALSTIVKTRNVWLMSIVGLCATGATWGVTNWANLFMTQNVGVSAVTAGSIVAIYGAAAFISKPLIGIISDHLNVKKNVIAAVCLFLFAPALIAFANTSSESLLYVTGTVTGVTAFVYSPLTNALAVSVAPAGCRGTSAGFVNLFNQIGSLSAPMILGGVLQATGSYQTAMMSIAVLPVVAAAVLLLVKVPSAK